MQKLLGVVAALVIACTALASAGQPASAATVIDPQSAKITIWYEYVAGSAEEAAFQTVLASVRPRFPHVTFTTVQKDFPNAYSQFRSDPAHGPDLLIVPNDGMAALVRARLVKDVTAAMKPRAANLTLQARAGSVMNGKYWMIPESSKTIGLLYTEARLATAPATTGALLTAVTGGLKLGFVNDAYWLTGFFPAFGGGVIDATYRCVADQTPGVANALAYLRQLALAGASAYDIPDVGRMQQDFRKGTLDAIVDINYFAGDYRKSLGDSLKMAQVPAGPVGPSKPFIGTDGWFVNAKRPNSALATRIALAMSDGAAQATESTKAVHVPADSTVAITDPLAQEFAAALPNGVLRPTMPCP